MIVNEFIPEVYEAIKQEGEPEYFSYIRKTRISNQFAETHFFRAVFTHWSAFEKLPYCTIKEQLGPIYDINNYKTVVLMNNNIEKEMYPP